MFLREPWILVSSVGSPWCSSSMMKIQIGWRSTHLPQILMFFVLKKWRSSPSSLKKVGFTRDSPTKTTMMSCIAISGHIRYRIRKFLIRQISVPMLGKMRRLGALIKYLFPLPNTYLFPKNHKKIWIRLWRLSNPTHRTQRARLPASFVHLKLFPFQIRKCVPSRILKKREPSKSNNVLSSL